MNGRPSSIASVCALVFSGATASSQWPGSRLTAAEKDAEEEAFRRYWSEPERKDATYHVPLIVKLAGPVAKSSPVASSGVPIRGIASTSDIDVAGDIVEAGAFGTIDPARVAMLYCHEPRDIIGRWLTFRQDGKHLLAEGMLAPALSKAREVHEMLKAEIPLGLSIGFRVNDAR